MENSGERTNREVVQDLYAALSRGDLPAAMDLIDPDVRYDEPPQLPFGGIQQGRDRFFRCVFGTMVAVAAINISELTVTESEFGAIACVTGTFVAHCDRENFPVRLVEKLTISGGIVRKIDVFMKDPGALAAFFARAGAGPIST